jgi:hypothetical protein
VRGEEGVVLEKRVDWDKKRAPARPAAAAPATAPANRRAPAGPAITPALVRQRLAAVQKKATSVQAARSAPWGRPSPARRTSVARWA